MNATRVLCVENHPEYMGALKYMLEAAGYEGWRQQPAAKGIATLVARSVDARSIYDARLTDEEIEQRQQQRDMPSQEASAATAQGSFQA